LPGRPMGATSSRCMNPTGGFYSLNLPKKNPKGLVSPSRFLKSSQQALQLKPFGRPLPGFLLQELKLAFLDASLSCLIALGANFEFSGNTTSSGASLTLC